MTKIQLLIDNELKFQTHIEEKDDLKELYLILKRFGIKVEKKAGLSKN